jgi:hypothetical protein
MHAIDPQINVLFIAQIALGPTPVLVGPAFLQALMVEADNPGASRPNSAVRASLKSPVDMPFKYRHGSSSSIVFSLNALHSPINHSITLL